MSKTKIEWTNATWNPVTGCTPVSEGCDNCYARRMAHRLAGQYGYPKAPHEFDVTLHPDRLDQPLQWKKPRMIFVCSMGDLFHEDVPVSFIAKIFNVMACATLTCKKRHEHTIECWEGEPHIFQVLTKRPERMLQVLNQDLPEYVGNQLPGDSPLSVAMDVQWSLPNAWLGVTAENQATADERIPLLLQCPAAVRFVSIEPMLSEINVAPYLYSDYDKAAMDTQLLTPLGGFDYSKLDWVIVGGETGPGARPMHPDWARSVRDQCQEASVPFFLKYLNKQDGRLLDEMEWSEMPEVKR